MSSCQRAFCNIHQLLRAMTRRVCVLLQTAKMIIESCHVLLKIAKMIIFDVLSLLLSAKMFIESLVCWCHVLLQTYHCINNLSMSCFASNCENVHWIIICISMPCIILDCENYNWMYTQACRFHIRHCYILWIYKLW